MFAPEGFVINLANDIREYHTLTSRLTPFSGKYIPGLEDDIRAKGKEIVKKAEVLAEAKKEKVSSVLVYSRNVLIISIIFLSTAGFAAGALFYRMFAKPLMHFEKHMKKNSRW